jgi:transposase
MLNIMSCLKIHHLREAGMTQEAIAAAVGCCVRTVRTVLKQRPPSPEEVSAGAMSRLVPLGRPEVLGNFRAEMTRLLAEDPGMSTAEVLRRLRSAGYPCSDRTVYGAVAQVRPAEVPASPEVRFEGLPGEFAQFDFGQCLVRFREGSTAKVRFFAGILKYSRHRHVEIVPDESAESLARATAACFHAWGGAPKQWVYDNPTTVWYDRKQRIAHPYLRQLLADTNSLVEATEPRRPNQKGAVENGVGFVKHGFFLGRSFQDPAEMAAELPGWLRWANEERPCAATGVTPATRLAEEQPRLAERRLGHTGASLPLVESSTVLPTGLVRYRGAAYSVDPRRLGAPATLLVRQAVIEIDVGGVRCVHPRQDHSGAVSRLPQHSLAQVAITTEHRKKTYAKRQHLFDLGPAAVTFCDHLIMTRPGNAWYADIHRLYDLAMSAGPSRFLGALTISLARKEITVAAVAAALGEAEVAS